MCRKAHRSKACLSKYVCRKLAWNYTISKYNRWALLKFCSRKYLLCYCLKALTTYYKSFSTLTKCFLGRITINGKTGKESCYLLSKITEWWLQSFCYSISRSYITLAVPKYLTLTISLSPGSNYKFNMPTKSSLIYAYRYKCIPYETSLVLWRS